MKSWYIDFRGYCEIEAETKEEAEAKFWDGYQSPSMNTLNASAEILSIEENDLS